MAVLPIVTYDSELLTSRAEPVTENSEELQVFIDDLFETMYNADGVGLAAPQVGRLIRIFVADADVMVDNDEDEEPVEQYGPIAMINPEIVAVTEEEIELEEGCLSIPGIKGAVTRPSGIRVRYLDRAFEQQQLEVNGWLARVIQHERDHLDGILFVDHLSMFKRKLLAAKLQEVTEGRMEADYPVVSKRPAAG